MSPPCPRELLAVCLTCLLGTAAPAGSPGRAAKPGAGKAPRVDTYGDPLPPGAVARLGTTRFRHRGQQLFLGFSPDGNGLVALTEDGLSRLDLATGRPGARVALSEGLGGRSAFDRFPRFEEHLPVSGDGRTVALGPMDVAVVDTATGKERARIPGEVLYPPVNNAVSISGGSSRLSHDGRLYAVSGQIVAERMQVAWFDTATGKQKHRVSTEPGGQVGVLDFSRDGKLLAFTEFPRKGRKVRLRQWDTNSGKEVRSIPVPGDQLEWFRFLPDGKALLARQAEDAPVRLLETATGKEIRSFPEKDGPVAGCSLSADGRLLAVVSNGRVRLWDVATGKQQRLLRHPALGVATRFSPSAVPIFLSADGKRLAAVTRHSLVLWDTGTGRRLNLTRGHEALVGAVAFEPGGKRLVSAAEDRTLRVWDVPSGKEDRRFVPSAEPKENDVLQMFLAELERLGQDVGTRARFSPDGKAVLAAWASGPVELWDAATAKPLRRFGEGKEGWPFAASPDGRLVATGSLDGLVRVREIATGKEVRRLVWHRPPGEEGDYLGHVMSLTFSPDGRALAGVGALQERGVPGVVVRLWEVRTARLRLEVPLNVSGGVPSSLARYADEFRAHVQAVFSPDGKALAVGTGNVVYLWDAMTGKELRQFAGMHVNATAVAFSPDGKLLAAGDVDGGLRLWRTDTGAVWCDVAGHEQAVTTVAFSPDGKLLASGSADSTALLWDVAQFPRAGRPAPGKPPALEALWADLGAADAATAYRAIRALAADPARVVPFLKGRLRPVAAPEPQRLDALVADLDAKRFATRDRAMRELGRLGELAAPALERRLRARPPLETRKRVEALLEKLRGPVTDPELLRGLRAVEALERIGSPAARALLGELAAGAAGHPLTEDARGALKRFAPPLPPTP
jgi:WD40 repeat protein